MKGGSAAAPPISFPLVTPREPEDTLVEFPDVTDPNVDDLIAVGEDFRAGTLLRAYRSGIFPWPSGRRVGWFSPDPRAIFPLDGELRWSRSLRRTLKRHPYRLTIDTAFVEVMRACGTERPEGTWITKAMVRGYTELHERGFAHSVEVWADEALVGGIYGLALGAYFAGESMFHRVTDASKIAFATLAGALQGAGFAMLDAQVMNPHLASLGCIDVPRAEFLVQLRDAVSRTPRSDRR